MTIVLLLMCWWLLCWCVDVLMTIVLMCWCVDVLMCWCIDLLMCWSIDVLMCWCVDVLMCWCVDVLMCWCVDVLMCWCDVDVLMCWCVPNCFWVLTFTSCYHSLCFSFQTDKNSNEHWYVAMSGFEIYGELRGSDLFVKPPAQPTDKFAVLELLSNSVSKQVFKHWWVTLLFDDPSVFCISAVIVCEYECVCMRVWACVCGVATCVCFYVWAIPAGDIKTYCSLCMSGVNNH